MRGVFILVLRYNDNKHLSLYIYIKNCCLQESERRLMNLASTAILIFISLKQCAYHVCVFTCYPTIHNLRELAMECDSDNGIRIKAYKCSKMPLPLSLHLRN